MVATKIIASLLVPQNKTLPDPVDKVCHTHTIPIILRANPIEVTFRLLQVGSGLSKDGLSAWKAAWVRLRLEVPYYAPSCFSFTLLGLLVGFYRQWLRHAQSAETVGALYRVVPIRSSTNKGQKYIKISPLRVSGETQRSGIWCVHACFVLTGLYFRV